jgi:hypothetical protein
MNNIVIEQYNDLTTGEQKLFLFQELGKQLENSSIEKEEVFDFVNKITFTPIDDIVRSFNCEVEFIVDVVKAIARGGYECYYFDASEVLSLMKNIEFSKKNVDIIIKCCNEMIEEFSNIMSEVREVGQIEELNTVFELLLTKDITNEQKEEIEYMKERIE